MKNLTLALSPIVLASFTRSVESPPALSARELILDLGNGVTMKLVRIPAGKFLMGSSRAEKGHFKNELQHAVTISNPFYLGKYPVTQEQWRAVMRTNPSRFDGVNLPVENVSWSDCLDFVTKVNLDQTLHGQQVSLPTEAQWEYACRAGTTTAYNMGDSEDALNEAGWYDGNSGSQTHLVGQKKPNTWGLYDMHGNVREWCSDWYGGYPARDATDPTGPKDGSLRVLRGGSWFTNPRLCRSAYRHRLNPHDQDGYYGFRVAVVAGGTNTFSC